MVKKTCPTCGRNSYSAVEEGTWICPYCRKDITKAPKEVDVDGEMPNIPLSKLWRES